MEKKEEQCIEEKTKALLAKQLGFLPEEIDIMQKLLKTTRDMLHFYLNEFGLHLEKDQQSELAMLSSKSDVLFLKIARLSFEARQLECEAKKSIEAKKEFNPEKKQTSAMSKELAENKETLLNLNKRVTSIVEEMKELPHAEQS